MHIKSSALCAQLIYFRSLKAVKVLIWLGKALGEETDDDPASGRGLEWDIET